MQTTLILLLISIIICLLGLIKNILSEQCILYLQTKWYSKILKQIWIFLIQEEKKDDTFLLVCFRLLKNVLQYIIGIGIFVIIAFKIYETVSVNFDSNMLGSCFNKLWGEYKSIKILQIVSIGLGAATAVELAYMLFTPGPDEAVQPVMMGVASAVLYALSNIGKLEGLELIGIALLICTLPLLFWLNHRMEEWQEQKRNGNNK